mmetsp:Transcript_171/g.568  ORF Transcript_171/g.568 Transcript_171/m.568 type:complete len:219 (+) Transcript_171:351-1007(+)
MYARKADKHAARACAFWSRCVFQSWPSARTTSSFPFSSPLTASCCRWAACSASRRNSSASLASIRFLSCSCCSCSSRCFDAAAAAVRAASRRFAAAASASFLRCSDSAWSFRSRSASTFSCLLRLSSAASSCWRFVSASCRCRSTSACCFATVSAAGWRCLCSAPSAASRLLFSSASLPLASASCSASICCLFCARMASSSPRLPLPGGTSGWVLSRS